MSESDKKMSVLIQMLVCVVGIYVCFGGWSIVQEKIVKHPYTPKAGGSEEFFTSTFSIALFQTLAGIAVSGLLMRFSGPKKESKPFEWKKLTSQDKLQIILLGFTNIFGTCFGYAAMRRLPYPLVLSAKMSKMIPVMVVGAVVHHTRYPAAKVAACLLITAGVLSFFLLEGKGPTSGSGNAAAATSTVSGLVLLAVNLCMDGFTHSTQDELVRRNKWSGNELMLITNVCSFFWMVATLFLLEIVTVRVVDIIVEPMTWFFFSKEAGHSFVVDHIAFNEMRNTFSFLATYSGALNDLSLLSLLNALGQIFIFRTVFLFGSLTVTAMTLLRKIGSVILSIVVYGHKLSPGQYAALLVIFAGVFLETRYNLRRGAVGPRRSIHQPLRPIPATVTTTLPPSLSFVSRNQIVHEKPKSPEKTVTVKSPAKLKATRTSKKATPTPSPTRPSAKPRKSSSNKGSHLQRMLEELKEEQRDFARALDSTETEPLLPNYNVMSPEEFLATTLPRRSTAAARRGSVSPRQSRKSVSMSQQ